MTSDIMVWDIETVPDLDGYARANNMVGRPPQEVRASIGDDFPKLIYQYASVRWSRPGRPTATRSRWSAHPTSVNGPRRN